MYGGWEQSSDDIRGDLALGWGDDRRASIGELASPGNESVNSINDNNIQDDWGWKLRSKAVRPVPAFYPMDPRSTRRINFANQERGGEGDNWEVGTSIKEITQRISRSCQRLSIHGIWDNKCSTAKLSSMERVEMEITIYLGEITAANRVLIVELQRRKGCSVTFHNYRRSLLDAAEGKFDPQSFHMRDGLDKHFGRDRTNQPRASVGRSSLTKPSLARPGLARPGLARPNLPSSSVRPTMTLSRPSAPPSPLEEHPILALPSLSPPSSPVPARPSPVSRPNLARPSLSRPPPMSSPPIDRPSIGSSSFSADDDAAPVPGLKTEGETTDETPVEKTLKALNMAASLIKKDRVDARRLGMESLVLLTDPLRAGLETAKIASKVVLLGSANGDEAGVGANEDDVDALFDESAGLGIREAILEIIFTDNGDETENLKTDEDGFDGIEKEFTDCLFNLCLIVLSNALHTIEDNHETGTSSADIATFNNGDNNEDDRKPSPIESLGDAPQMRPSEVTKRFIDESNSTFGIDVLSSLLKILGQAKANPHDAYHSARCLGALFKGCGNSHKVRARRDLDAKHIIAAALEVGSRSHAKLEDACRVAMMALVIDSEGNVVEEKEDEEVEKVDR